jgi:hypothetical protein
MICGFWYHVNNSVDGFHGGEEDDDLCILVPCE